MNFEPGTGWPRCAVAMRSGAKYTNLPSHYGNMNLTGLGMWDGEKVYSCSSQVDSEGTQPITGTKKANRIQTDTGFIIRNQSTGDSQGVREKYDVSAVEYDRLELNAMQETAWMADSTWAMVVPFTKGVQYSKTRPVQAPVGAGTVTLDIGFRPHLIFFSSTSNPISPAASDAIGGTAVKHIADAEQSIGIALNKNDVDGVIQRNMEWSENQTTFNGVHNPCHQLRQDAVISNTFESVNLYTGSISQWDDNNVGVTFTAGSNGEWFQYMAIRFEDPTYIDLVDTAIYAGAAEWRHAGLGYRPNAVLHYANAYCQTLDQVNQDEFGFAIQGWDVHECWSIGISCPNNISPADPCADAWFANDIYHQVEDSGVFGQFVTWYQGEHPRFTADGWRCKLSSPPPQNSLGFALVTGGPE